MKLRTLAIAALAAITLGACSKDGNDGKFPMDGEETYASITLSMARANTRAHLGDLTATAEESNISSFTLFIFNSGDVLEKMIEFNTGQTTATFKTTVGDKSFIGVANVMAPTGTFTEGTSTLAEVKKHQFSTPTVATAATDDNFWMTTTSVVTTTLVPATAAEAAVDGHLNNIVLPVGRAVAKVGVYFDEENVPVGGGTLKNLEFRMANNPAKMYLFAEKDPSGILNTPAWDDTDIRPNHYYNDPNYHSTALSGTQFADPTYTIENSNRVAKKGNATYLLLKGTFVPGSSAAWLDAAGNGATAPATGVSFWRVANLTGGVITSWEPQYYTGNPSGVISAGQKAYEYENGLCYYALYLADPNATISADKYSVYRNQYWSVNITEIEGIGYPNEEGEGDGSSPDGPDPGEVIEGETQVYAKVEVVDWVSVEMDGKVPGM